MFAVSSRSFTPYGMPCSGPRYLPAAISASACLACCSARSVREGDDATQLGIVLAQPLQIDVGEPLGGQLALLESSPRAGVTDAKAMSSSFDGSGPGSALLRTKRFCAGPDFSPGMTGSPDGCGSEGRLQRGFARPNPHLVQRSHRHAPVARGFGKLSWGHLHLHKLFGFGEGGRRDLRSNRRRSAESRRRAGGLLLRRILGLGIRCNRRSQQLRVESESRTLCVISLWLSCIESLRADPMRTVGSVPNRMRAWARPVAGYTTRNSPRRSTSRGPNRGAQGYRFPNGHLSGMLCYLELIEDLRLQQPGGSMPHASSKKKRRRNQHRPQRRRLRRPARRAFAPWRSTSEARGVKAMLLDEAGKPLTERLRARTPDPSTPKAITQDHRRFWQAVGRI